MMYIFLTTMTMEVGENNNWGCAYEKLENSPSKK